MHKYLSNIFVVYDEALSVLVDFTFLFRVFPLSDLDNVKGADVLVDFPSHAGVLHLRWTNVGEVRVCAPKMGVAQHTSRPTS